MRYTYTSDKPPAYGRRRSWQRPKLARFGVASYAAHNFRGFWCVQKSTPRYSCRRKVPFHVMSGLGFLSELCLVSHVTVRRYIYSEADGSAVDILRCIRMHIQSTVCIYRVSESADRSSSNSIYTVSQFLSFTLGAARFLASLGRVATTPFHQR